MHPIIINLTQVNSMEIFTIISLFIIGGVTGFITLHLWYKSNDEKLIRANILEINQLKNNNITLDLEINNLRKSILKNKNEINQLNKKINIQHAETTNIRLIGRIY